MKKLLPLLLMLGLTGCWLDEPYDAELEYAKKQAELEAKHKRQLAQIENIKRSGGFRVVEGDAVCINGVLYYEFRTTHGYRVYSPTVNAETLQFERCVDAAAIR